MYKNFVQESLWPLVRVSMGLTDLRLEGREICSPHHGQLCPIHRPQAMVRGLTKLPTSARMLCIPGQECKDEPCQITSKHAVVLPILEARIAGPWPSQHLCMLSRQKEQVADWYLYKKRLDTERDQGHSCTEGPPWEEAARGWTSGSQGKWPGTDLLFILQETKPEAPWSWAFQSPELWEQNLFFKPSNMVTHCRH